MINFFAKPPFEMRHLQRVSSIVRGEQIAAYMGNARLNPPSINDGDVNIFVKPHIKRDGDFDFPKNSWVDIQDGWDLVFVLAKHPEVGVISYSDYETKVLKEVLTNKLVQIPHHHVNFEKTRRNRDKIKKVGLTGSGGAWEHVPQELKDGLKKRGIKFEYFSSFYPRMSVAKFHESMDIHMHWRPSRKRRLACPFKIINAASFGVPTIALDEPSFFEAGGMYIGVRKAQEWLDAFDFLVANDDIYNQMSATSYKLAEKYHIDNIAKLYKELDK